MRRAAVFERIKQEPELSAGLLFTDTKNAEHFLLHLVTMDTNRTAAQLGTIKNHIIGTRQSRLRVRRQLFRATARCGERVVNSGQAAIRQNFKHGEVDYPHRCPFAGQHLQVVTNTNTQCAKGFVHNCGLIGTEEYDIAVFSPCPLYYRHGNFVAKELNDGRLQAFYAFGKLIHLDVSQTFGTVDADKFSVFVDLLTTQLATFGNTQSGYSALGIIRRPSKHFEINASNQVAHILKL